MGNFKVLQQNDNRVPQKATEKETGRVDGVLQIFAPVVPYIHMPAYLCRTIKKLRDGVRKHDFAGQSGNPTFNYSRGQAKSAYQFED